MVLDAKIPGGFLEDKWTRGKNDYKLINPANKRKFEILVVGTGLAGASAAASLAELGYQVKSFCIQDSPRRAHSISAQGGINAAKNYPNDGDSVYRLFHDTIKGGDYRSREANVYRLSEISNSIIDQCVAQGVPFAREYAGTISNRSFGGAQVSRTFYARGQTGQQLLLGAYSALTRQIGLGCVKMYPRREMLDLVVIDGHARGIIVRNLITGEIESYKAHAVILATGGYSNAYFLSTSAMSSNATAIWRAHKRGAFFANPCFVQIHPTCIPVRGETQSKLTLMSESLRNDGRIWVPLDHVDVRTAKDIPESDRDYFLERKYPAFGNLVPRDVASRNTKEVCDEGHGVGPTKKAVYLDFSDAIQRLGEKAIREKYGNLFDMYEEITGENPYQTPMMIYPAPHYTMGGLWVDYHLMSTVDGLFVLGEANFSDHGSNRLGASALMQGLADGYFIIPYTLSDYLAKATLPDISLSHDLFLDSVNQVKTLTQRLLDTRGGRTVDEFHKALGNILWKYVGMSRNHDGLVQSIEEIKALRDEFWQDVNIVGKSDELNQTLEKAGRVLDFMELGELMGEDALLRKESCGCHFRVESQTADNEAKRDDKHFTHVAAWEYQGFERKEKMHKEELPFEFVTPTERSYK